MVDFFERTGYRLGHCPLKVPRRCVPWPEKVFNLEQYHEKDPGWSEIDSGVFLVIRDESEVAVVETLHGIFSKDNTSKDPFS